MAWCTDKCGVQNWCASCRPRCFRLWACSVLAPLPVLGVHGARCHLWVFKAFLPADFAFPKYGLWTPKVVTLGVHSRVAQPRLKACKVPQLGESIHLLTIKTGRLDATLTHLPEIRSFSFTFEAEAWVQYGDKLYSKNCGVYNYRTTLRRVNSHCFGLAVHSLTRLHHHHHLLHHLLPRRTRAWRLMMRPGKRRNSTASPMRTSLASQKSAHPVHRRR